MELSPRGSWPDDQRAADVLYSGAIYLTRALVGTSWADLIWVKIPTVGLLLLAALVLGV